MLRPDFTSGFWESLTRPGDFVTVFVSITSKRRAEAGFPLRWSWSQGTGIEDATMCCMVGHELPDAYHTALEMYRRVRPRGSVERLSLHAEDVDFLRSRGFVISGASLGLAMLLGLVFQSAGQLWPQGLFAWGNIRPVRNNRFALYGVDRIGDKLGVAETTGMNTLVHPSEEGVCLGGRTEYLWPRYPGPGTIEALFHEERSF